MKYVSSEHSPNLNPHPSPNLSLSESYMLLKPENRVPINFTKIHPGSKEIEWISSQADLIPHETLEDCMVRLR